MIEILKKWNFWEKEQNTGKRRSMYIEKIFPYLERREVLVLKGIRRSGKSTIMKQLILELIKKGINKKETLYINLEDFAFADNLNIALFDDVIKAYKVYTKNTKKIYFFIDEIQKIPSWEKWIRTMYDQDENIKFIISGSSASLLSKELSTLLTGRNISFTIMPLSYQEIITFNPPTNLETYFKFGGFPEVVLEKSEEKKTMLLQQYFEDILHKDIIDRHSIRNAKQIMDLARYLISSSGSKMSISKLSKVFGIAKDTLQTYVNYMIDAYLLKEVRYFTYSAKDKYDPSKLPKVYCIDHGLITIVNFKYSKNRGQMFENSVLIKLAHITEEVSYWGTAESEVDFVYQNTALNVTATDHIKEREQKGLEDFGKKNKGFQQIIISQNMKKENVIPLKEFLMRNLP